MFEKFFIISRKFVEMTLRFISGTKGSDLIECVRSPFRINANANASGDCHHQRLLSLSTCLAAGISQSAKGSFA